MKTRVWSGLDRIETIDAALRGKRIGLMTNPTGMNHAYQSTVDVVRSRYNLTALFACEHGIRGDVQAGQPVETYRDEETGVTVYSTYEKSHHLTEAMLGAMDVFLFDMQDVGVRFYTYLYSLAYAMRDCAAAGKPVVVLDRLNPVGGLRREGTVLDPAFASFVGDYALPSRTGLTIGEYALYVKDYLKLDLDLTVVPLAGWSRALYLDDTDTPWVAPSPNCPTLHAALCYIGTCIFEGTNLSEGRGTTLPFELIGAPWIDARALEAAMAKRRVPGLRFRRASFVPTFSKYAGQQCFGVQMHIVDRETALAFEGGLQLLDEVRAQWPDAFEFLQWGGRFGLDRLLGTDAYRVGGLSAQALTAAHAPKLAAFSQSVQANLLYA